MWSVSWSKSLVVLTLVAGLFPGLARAEEISPLQARVDGAANAALVRVEPGEYLGSLHIRHPVVLEGAGLGETTLQNTGKTAIFIESPGVILRNMTVVAGTAVSVHSGASLVATGLDLWGTADVISVDASATMTLDGSGVTCEGEARPVGAVVLGRLEATDTRWSGPCQRSVHVGGGTLLLRRSDIDGGIDTGVHIVGGTAELDDVHAALSNRDGSVVFGGEAVLVIKRAHLDGGLEGILLRGGKAEMTDSTIRGAIGAGLAAQRTVVHLARVTVEGPFNEAALLVQEGSTLTGEAVTVKRGGVAGVLVVRGDAHLSGASLSGLRSDHDGDFGHGVVVEEGRAELDDLTVNDAQGAAVYASNPTTMVVVTKSRFSNVAVGLAVVHGAHIRASDCSITRSGAGLAATEGAVVALEGGEIQAEIGVVEAKGTHAVLMSVKVAAPVAHREINDEDFDSVLRDANAIKR